LLEIGDGDASSYTSHVFLTSFSEGLSNNYQNTGKISFFIKKQKKTFFFCMGIARKIYQKFQLG
jgi:hypothetical protein